MPPPPLSSTANHPIIRSQTKVETQNLASPVPSMPTYACYNTLTTNAFLPCRDAKSCVSRPTPCRHTQAIIRWQHTHFSLVRRKILRLYMLPPSLSSTATYPIIRSQTKVETQNLASPVLPIPTYARDNTLASNAHLPRETQNLASLQGWRPHYACILFPTSAERSYPPAAIWR